MFSFPYQVNLAPTTHTLSREAGHPIVGRVLPLRYKGRTLHFYSKLCISRGLHNPDEFTLEMRVDVERLKMGIVLSQPVPWLQCDLLPRQLPAVDTGSEEPGWLPAIGTGSDEPGVSRA